MNEVYVLYNPCAGNNNGEKRAKQLNILYPNKALHYVDMTKIESCAYFILGLTEEDIVILCGGDGTLNRFINDIDGIKLSNRILYYPTGSGNDFARDTQKPDGSEPFEITGYLNNLPVVYVNDEQYRFINGIGYGIDGYCCEVGDKLREKSDKPINYTAIAVKGLLFHYKPTSAKITVDGVSRTYNKVWLSPTMHGRYYGGGMIPTPQQSRNNPESLSVMVFHGTGKLTTLMVFPSIFKGEHIKHKDMIDVLTGRDITVEFDRPTALQIDGETILNVTSYRAVSPACTEEKGLLQVN